MPYTCRCIKEASRGGGGAGKMGLSTRPAPKASMGLGPGIVWAWDLGAVQLGLGPGPVWAWDLGAVQLLYIFLFFYRTLTKHLIAL